MESKKPLLTEQFYDEIVRKFANSGDSVPEFVLAYEEKEPVLCTRVKKACADIAVSYKNDLLKSNVKKHTAEQLSNSIRADMYVMSLYGYMISDKSKDICWEHSVRNMWDNSSDEES